MATKILGLDALTHIKDYVDGTSSNINYRIDTEIKNHIADKIAEATTNIQTDYDTQYTELINRISYVEQNGTVEEIAELRLKLDALDANTQNKFNALDGISRELNKLTVDYQALYEGVTTGSVFSAGQLNEIINTAMIDSVDIGSNAILTPEMYASKLVSLIGNFGQINAANIIGGDIKGHTISSNNVITGTEDPVWTIKDEGDGWLAKKNIQWDKNGNVTFGEGVQLKFSNISDANEKLNDLLSNYDETIQDYIKDYVQNATPDANTEQELINLLSSSTIPTTVDGDMVMSPNVIAQKLVSLVGTFGTVNASNIVGEDIQGYTLSSPRTKKDSEGNIIYKEGEYEYALDAQGNKIQATDEHNTPLVDAQGNPVYVYAADKDGNKIPVPDTLSEEETAWILRADGTGHLANGNINWTKDGNLNVKGKITGSIGIKKTSVEGSDDENVYVDGNIVITNDDKPTTIIAGEYAYPTPNEDEIDGRTINISSGFTQSDVIYEWNNLDGVIDGVIPSSIYTLTDYTKGTLGTNVSDAYYKQNDNFYPIELNCYTDAYDVNSTTLRLCLTIEFNNVFYRFAGPVEHTISEVENNLNDFANTNIYSDGTIYTNSIIANAGQFNGTINSDGNFYGELQNATGSIINTDINDSNLVLSNDNYFVVKQPIRTMCGVNDCNHTMIVDKDFEFIKAVKKFVTDNNIEVENHVKTLLDQYDDGYFQSGMLYWHCSNTTPVIYENNGKTYTIATNIKEVLDSDEYTIGSLYIPVPTELMSNYNEATGMVYNDIFSIKPSLTLHDNGGYSAPLPSITKEYTSNINANYEHQVRYKLWSFDIFACNHARDGFKFPSIHTKAIIYQPNAVHNESCNPTIKLYWKYDIDPMEDKYFHEFNVFNNSEMSRFIKLNNDDSIINENMSAWSSDGPGETVFGYNRTGTISIYADFTVFLSKKQDINKANYKLSFSTGGYVSVIGNYIPTTSTVTVASNGIMVVSNTGNKFLTCNNGDIKMISSDGMHGLSISNTGVMIKAYDGEWQNLSYIIYNLNK